MAKIELTALVKEWALYVRLKNVCACTAIIIGLLFTNAVLDLLQASAVLDVSASVAEFSWLYYPAITALFAFFIKLP
jgi:hypothetical protein